MLASVEQEVRNECRKNPRSVLALTPGVARAKGATQLGFRISAFNLYLNITNLYYTSLIKAN